MLVCQILGAKPQDKTITVRPDMSINDVVGVLTKHRIGAVVVSKDDVTPLGILSERDVVRALGQEGAARLEDRVDTLMTRELVSCKMDDKSDEVLTKMTHGRFRHMPVVENDRMVGFISIGDVVKARLSQLSTEKEALESMIMGY